MPARKPTTKAGKKAAMKDDMDRFKKGKLRSGSAKGPKVKDKAQAIAIGLKQSGQSKGDKAARAKRLEGKEM